METNNKKLLKLNKNSTGLVMNVELTWQDGEIPYIFVQNDYENKHNLNLIKVRLDGTVIGNKKPIFEEHEIEELKSWIDINKLLILMHWTKEKINIKEIRAITAIEPKYYFNNNNWESKKIIHARELEKYFDSLRNKIMGKTINRIYYTGTLYNRMWDEFFKYHNGEWYQDDEKIDEPQYYPWKESNTTLWLDSPVILDFEGTRLEIQYWSGSLVDVNTNSIDIKKYGADVSKHFVRNIIGHRLVDIKIHKTKKVYFMNFEHLNIERNDGDDMFEEIWFIFDNNSKLELTTDHCDYTIFSEINPI